jgi:hypothetical protein
VTAFEPLRLLRALVEGGVRFIVIGGVGAQYTGSPIVTFDLDICPARDRVNLDALAHVLLGLHSALRGASADQPFRLDGRTLEKGDAFTFTTDAGDLDVLGTPSGTGGFDDLARTAVRYDVDGLPILVASIDDLTRMKRAAGRSKDLVHLEHLAALRDELDRQER